ncbi:MAG TPA: hypothetical protein VFE52_03210 [Devosia sp.]|jgi:hypothetical protein|nr:hypothetical protein [Devosia sp.]
MRLIIHAGTHKTASTFLQHVLVLNAGLLAAKGIYAQPDAKMTGNHGTAWMTLLEDYRHVGAHVTEATRQGRSSVLLSSEDFETLIFDGRRARLVEQAARDAGAGSVEWAFCLREPGSYFSSLMAQLSKTGFVDFLGALASTLRDGRLRVFRERKRYPLYWDFCFDYEAHLTAFASAVTGEVRVHDFADGSPFPGHRIFEMLGVDPSTLAVPAAGSRNPRLPRDESANNRGRQLRELLLSAGMDPMVVEGLTAHARVSAAEEEEAERAVDRAFSAGMRSLLDQRVLRREEK